MKNYTFWKENLKDQKFTLTIDELKTKFVDWMKTKEKSWLDYYSITLANTFVYDKQGLNSVASNYQKLSDNLDNTKWKYLDSIGIN